MDRLTSVPLPRLGSVFVGLTLIVLAWLAPPSHLPSMILAAESSADDTPEGDVPIPAARKPAQPAKK